MSDKFSKRSALSLTPVSVNERDIWLLPSARYEFWVPGRAGRSARKIEPPECLAFEGRQLSGSAAEEALIASARSDEARVAYSELIASFSESADEFTHFVPSSRPGYVSAFDDMVAVLVPDGENGYRVDLWSATFDRPVAILRLPEGWKPHVIVLNDESLWLLINGSFKQITLPAALFEPLENPCDSEIVIRADDRIDE